MVVRREREVAPGGLEIGRPERLAERIGIRHARFGGGGDQQVRGVEALARIERRQAAVFGLEALDEGLIGRIVDVLRPLRGVLHTQRRLADRLQDALIEGEGRPDERNVEAGLGILLEEGDAHAAGQEEVHAVGARGPDLRDLRRVLVRAQLGVDLVGDRALIEALVAGEHVPAGGIVGREDEAVGVAGVIRVAAGCLGKIVVLPGDVEVVFVTAFAS